jgi:hypothetical protein
MSTHKRWIKDSIHNTRLASEQAAGIEIRSLIHNKSSSNDTHDFSAQICVDGVKILRVENDGKGGDNYYHRSKKRVSIADKESSQNLYRKLIDIAKQYCQSERWYDYEEIRLKEQTILDDGIPFYNQDDVDFSYLDILVGALVNEQLTLKEMSKAIRNRIHIIDTEANDSGGFLYSTNKRPTDIHLANAKKAIKGIGKHFNYILMNELDEMTQLKLWLTIN